eukprot:7887794-Pyramimonas_sp.AAC.1
MSSVGYIIASVWSRWLPRGKPDLPMATPRPSRGPNGYPVAVLRPMWLSRGHPEAQLAIPWQS